MSNFSAEEQSLLRNCELLKELSDKNFHTFISLSQRTFYAADEVLLEEGQNSNHLFILISGTVTLYKSTNMNKDLIGSLSSGQSIGEMRVIRNQPCSLTVITNSPTVALCIPLDKLRHLEYNQCYESILDAIINILSYRLIQTNQLAVTGVNKKKSMRNRIFPLAVMVVATLFIGELGVALYYFMS
jgi:CRP/FNR family cyclic AMP-dependent transcriptional regulator